MSFGIRLSMEKVREVLRLSSQGVSQSEISRSCKVSRPTVRDYLRRASAAGITYEDYLSLSSQEQQRIFEKKQRGRRIKDEEVDYKAVCLELRKKGVTLQLLWEEYLREHPDGYGYSQFCYRYRRWQTVHEISLRRYHKSGESIYVDYSGQTVELVDSTTGEVSTAQIFVATFGASNYTYCEATSSQQLSDWLGSHVRMFEFFGGVPELVVPDNLKSGVTSACRYEPGINRSYQELAEHYGVAIVPTRIKKPKDKAKVENAVLQVERRILARLRNDTFHCLGELNAAIGPLLKELNQREMKGYGASRQQLFEQLDLPCLRSLPVNRYEFGYWKQAKVNIDYHIEIERHFYSVPYRLRGETLWVRYNEQTVSVFHKNTRIAVHYRSHLKGRHTTDSEHMPPQHRCFKEWTPQRLLSWAETIGPQTYRQVQSLLLARKHPEQAYRSCLGLLGLAKKFGNQRLEAACTKANQLKIVSMKSIKNMLSTGYDRINQPQQFSPEPAHHCNVRGESQFH